MCLLIGDTNLDYHRWDNPEPSHSKMVQRTKDVIEAAGHVQIIKGITRCWPGQVDSLVDQCWVNRPGRIISHQNKVRSSSDHNTISVLVRTKDKMAASQELLKRSWKNFSPENFRQELSMLDWSNFYQTENLDKMNTIFEENVLSVLEKVAPMKLTQLRKNHRNWVDQELKNLMLTRDSLREHARLADSQDLWRNYRRTKNECTKLLKKKKVVYFQNLYKTFEAKNYSKNIFGLTKEVLGWTNSGTPTCLISEGKMT